MADHPWKEKSETQLRKEQEAIHETRRNIEDANKYVGYVLDAVSDYGMSLGEAELAREGVRWYMDLIADLKNSTVKHLLTYESSDKTLLDENESSDIDTPVEKAKWLCEHYQEVVRKKLADAQVYHEQCNELYSELLDKVGDASVSMLLPKLIKDIRYYLGDLGPGATGNNIFSEAPDYRTSADREAVRSSSRRFISNRVRAYTLQQFDEYIRNPANRQTGRVLFRVDPAMATYAAIAAGRGYTTNTKVRSAAEAGDSLVVMQAVLAHWTEKRGTAVSNLEFDTKQQARITDPTALARNLKSIAKYEKLVLEADRHCASIARDIAKLERFQLDRVLQAVLDAREKLKAAGKY